MRYARIMAATLAVWAVGFPARAGLLWDAETAGGHPITVRGEGVPFNPASVVKIGTTWFALERLGPEHRYVTTFGYTGTLDRRRGRLDGTLAVAGGSDPDFQVENALRVTRALNAKGVRKVSGGLTITGSFWMGWEGGPFRRKSSRTARLLLAGQRLRRAMNPALWNAALWKTWRELAHRHGWDVARPPGIVIDGPTRVSGSVHSVALVVHRSNPLRVILKRFDVFSNNDIERIADPLGGAPAVQAFVRDALGDRSGRVQLETACGEGVNRMTARLVVRMLVRFRRALARFGLEPRDLLPVPGCDPGPVPVMFPKLARGRLARAVVCKTGTLSSTDGGVAVVAGFFETPDGHSIVFCVAAPRAGEGLHRWRQREQRWLLRLIRREGGAVRRVCGAPFVLSDQFATVQPVPGPGRRSP